jgi:sulfur-carrier protein
MPIIRFTPALSRFFPGLQPQTVGGRTVAEALEQVEQAVPGLRAYLLDEQGRLRKHVNIYVAGSLLQNRETLADELSDNTDMLVFQALSGG